MTTTMTVTGEGISIEREVSESTALKIMEISIDDEIDEDDSKMTVTLSGEGIEFDRDISETTGVEALDVAVHEGSQAVTNSEETESDGLPENFFDRLSEKQRIMLEILLEADGEWMRGTDIRQKMREEYDMNVGEGGRATAGVIAGLTRKYDEDLRRDIIPGRWADETQQHAEFKIGDKYKAEIRERFEEQ
jgi:hypothetical protein